jgi:carbamoyltransferase
MSKKNDEVIWGISAGFHDASLSVIYDGHIVFAGHSERYSGVKNDKFLNPAIVRDAELCQRWYHKPPAPDVVVYYENPFLNWTRRLYAGQRRGPSVYQHIRDLGLMKENMGIQYYEQKLVTVGHHESHAAAGFYTSPFEEAAIVVIDAIGEWDTTSVWIGKGNSMKKIWSAKYPNSMGLLYSAFTQRCGFKPNEEEHSLMALSAYGVPKYSDAIKRDFIELGEGPEYTLKQNVHTGIGNWMPAADPTDLAASIQKVLEEYLERLFDWVEYTTKQQNLVYMGGVALNCVANSNVLLNGVFDDVWIMPNPGDAGSSLGAALAYLGEHVSWESPYLGAEPWGEIEDGYKEDSIRELLAGNPIAWTWGRAEFGPRALGNRSLLIDPRFRTSRHKMNKIKQRQSFRPFAACVLEERASEYFDMGKRTSLPYMQYAVKVKKPRELSAVVHIDNTCRVQTVTRDQNPHLADLLERWGEATGCSVLLNTSLNTKGQPLINNDDQAKAFAKEHGIRHY